MHALRECGHMYFDPLLIYPSNLLLQFSSRQDLRSLVIFMLPRHFFCLKNWLSLMGYPHLVQKNWHCFHCLWFNLLTLPWRQKAQSKLPRLFLDRSPLFLSHSHQVYSHRSHSDLLSCFNWEERDSVRDLRRENLLWCLVKIFIDVLRDEILWYVHPGWFIVSLLFGDIHIYLFFIFSESLGFSH